MIYQRLYNTYEYSTQYHNLYNDISYGHHIMVYTTISTLLLRSWTISHFPENLNVLPHTTKEGLRYISHIVYFSHLIRYLIHWMQWKLQLFCYFGQNLLVDRTNDIICLMWALMTGAIVLIRRPPPRKCFSIKNDKSPVSLGAIKWCQGWCGSILFVDLGLIKDIQGVPKRVAMSWSHGLPARLPVADTPYYNLNWTWMSPSLEIVFWPFLTKTKWD